MDFGNIANTAQDLVKNAQGMMNSNPDLLNKAESMTGMDLNQDGSTGGVTASVPADDTSTAQDSTSDEAVTTEESTIEETQETETDEVSE